MRLWVPCESEERCEFRVSTVVGQRAEEASEGLVHVRACSGFLVRGSPAEGWLGPGEGTSEHTCTWAVRRRRWGREGEQSPGERRVGGEQMGKQLGERSAGETNDSEGQEGAESKEGRSWVRPRSEGSIAKGPRRRLCQQSGLTAASPSSGLSGGQGLFVLPPHLRSQ